MSESLDAHRPIADGPPTAPGNVVPDRTLTPVARWRGEPGMCGTVAVVGLGRVGLPLAAHHANAGWRVIGVDVVAERVEGINSGTLKVEEPGLAQQLAAARASGRLTATLSHADAVAQADVVLMLVPLLLSEEQQPDYRTIDRATRQVGEAIRPGTLVIYETTLPVGDTRLRFGPMLEQASGLRMSDPEAGFLLAHSPERVFGGQVLQDLETIAKVVGGVDRESAGRAVAFFEGVSPTPVREVSSSEAAELVKLASAAYRDVNIALANELARFAERAGVDILEVIESANEHPLARIHDPGLGVGGYSTPIHPHLLLHGAPDLQLVADARRVNQDQVGHAIHAIQRVFGDLDGVPILVLGLTYRHGVRGLAYSRALPLIERLRFLGAEVTASDPLLSDGEVQRCGATPYAWGSTSDTRAIVTQTADPLFESLDWGWFPRLELLFDGRNSLRTVALPARVRYLGVGMAGDREAARGLSRNGQRSRRNGVRRTIGSPVPA